MLEDGLLAALEVAIDSSGDGIFSLEIYCIVYGEMCDEIVYSVNIHTRKIQENLAANQCVRQELGISPFVYFLSQ